jgi:hypothetical protein
MKIILMVLMVLMCISPVAASDLSIEIGAGATLFQPTTADGTWWQAPFKHSFSTKDLALRGGLTYTLSDEWSLNGSYTRLGKVTADAFAVGDQDYDAKNHRCLAHCLYPVHFAVRDVMQGPEFTVRRSFPGWDLVPYIKAGGAVMFHEITLPLVNTLDGGDVRLHYAGTVPMVVIGGGTCYKIACIDLSYYYGIGSVGVLGIRDSGYPISTRAFVPMFSLRIPF